MHCYTTEYHNMVGVGTDRIHTKPHLQQLTCGVVGYLRHKDDVIWRSIARDSRVSRHVRQQLTPQRLITCSR
jgi:hypothetical protein